MPVAEIVAFLPVPVPSSIGTRADRDPVTREKIQLAGPAACRATSSK
jgi:hypothetical protein